MKTVALKFRTPAARRICLLNGSIAEGAEKCDFRFKKGRATFVYPLRKGWPPDFHNDDSKLSELKR